MLWDPEGVLRGLFANGPEPDRSTSIEFWDPDGHYRAGVGHWPDGSAGLEILDDRGKVRVRVAERADRSAGVEVFERRAD